jgi:hypothetical protein
MAKLTFNELKNMSEANEKKLGELEARLERTNLILKASFAGGFIAIMVLYLPLLF